MWRTATTNQSHRPTRRVHRGHAVVGKLHTSQHCISVHAQRECRKLQTFTHMFSVKPSATLGHEHVSLSKRLTMMRTSTILHVSAAATGASMSLPYTCVAKPTMIRSGAMESANCTETVTEANVAFVSVEYITTSQQQHTRIHTCACTITSCVHPQASDQETTACCFLVPISGTTRRHKSVSTVEHRPCTRPSPVGRRATWDK